MTISSSVRTAGPYLGTGMATSFPFSFKVFNGSDVEVVRSDGFAQTRLTYLSHYTVVLNGDQDKNPGGSVTLVGAPLSVDNTLTLSSDIPDVQGISLTNGGGFYPKVIEAALDRATILVQQLKSRFSRSLSFPVSDTGVNTELPPLKSRANNLLGFDSAGNPVAVAPVAQSANALQASLVAVSGSAMIGHQPGSGAGTTLQAAVRGVEWLRDQGVSIKDPRYAGGARGSALSPDDTAAIQAALNAAAGGVLFIPAGTYIVTTLTVPANTTVIGQGANCVLKRKAGASAGPLLTATGASRITVANLTLDGNRAACTGGDSCVYFGDGYEFVIDRVRAINSIGHAISLQRTQDRVNNTTSTIRDCVATNPVGYGIEAQDTSRISILGNRITKSGAAGIVLYGTVAYVIQNAIIEGNFVADAGASGIVVPFVNGGTALTPGVDEVIIADNTVERSGHNGYVVQGRFATVTGNMAVRNGVTMDHQGFVINVVSVTLSGNTASRNAGVGIDFGDCKRVIAIGNLVEENGIIGIEVNSTEDFVVSGNMVINNNQTAGAGALGAGILVHLGTGGYTFLGLSMNGVVSNNIVRAGPSQQFGIKATGDTANIRFIGNDALSSGTVRDFEILVPTGQFVESGNTINSPTLTPAATVTIPQVGNMFYVAAGATRIDNIITDGATYEIGRTIRLRFNGAASVGNGAGNIYLNGSILNANVGTVLVLLRSDAGGWTELSRRT